MDPSAKNASFYIIPAPFLASSGEMARAITEEASVSEILSMNKLADMTIVGIGCPDENATVVKEGKLTSADLVVLEKAAQSATLSDTLSTGTEIRFEAPVHESLRQLCFSEFKT